MEIHLQNQSVNTIPQMEEISADFSDKRNPVGKITDSQTTSM